MTRTWNTDITRLKLKRHDYFRPQIQLEYEGKIVWAADYNFLADKYPQVAKDVREFVGDLCIKKVQEILDALKKSSPIIAEEHRDWLRKHVPENDLLVEINNELHL